MASPGAPAQPSLKDFYEGLYFSPIYAKHHRVACNVGFHPVSPSNDAHDLDDEELAPIREAARKFHEQHTPGDVYSLQLYRELVTMVAPRLLFPHAKAASDQQSFYRSRLSILDVGCGPGGGACALKTLFPFADYTGVDISSQAIVRSKTNWMGFAKQVPVDRKPFPPPKWINQSCERMHNIRTESVDMAVAVQSLQEVQDLRAALSELERVVKPGGVLFIADFIPQDDTRDYIYRELLELVTFAPDQCVWEIEQERLVSFNAAMACKLNSERMQQLLLAHIPAEFRPDLETLFFVEKSVLYERLQRCEMGYRLVCLRKKGSLDLNPFVVATSEDDTESVEEDEEYDHDDEDCDDHDAEETEPIHDEDLPNYYEYKELFPQLEVLKANYDVILEELQTVQAATSWPFWPEKHYSEGESEWRVFPFCYTFPAYDASKTTWVDQTSALCPRTASILRNLPGIRTALFSKLGPNTILAAHRGWADLSNHILRCHLGLTVPTLPNGKPCCAMVVGGQVNHHEERELMVFDDSKLHYAFNHSADKTRFVLIVDLYRPDHLPRGRATGGHTDELDEFIKTFGQQAFGADESDDQA